MENVSPVLRHVPFQVPIPGMTFEEYLQYRTWRIEIQILATVWMEWKHSASHGERERLKAKIIEQLVAINRRATRFPAQPLPADLPTTVVELTDPNVRPGILSMPTFLQELAQVFA